MSVPSSIRKLKCVVFMGSGKTITPPWGGPARLCTRVTEYVKSVLNSRSGTVTCGKETIEYETTVYDPAVVFAPGGALAESGGQLSSPHFFYGAGKAPEAMDAMRDTIKAADCFLVVTPEYNHSLPPALSSLMGHFGGSNFQYKPCAVVAYSSGPWGGARVAMATRPFLAELGCVVVGKMTMLPCVGEIIKEDGSAADPQHRMLGQLPKMLTEMEWLTVAMINQRLVAGLPTF